MKVRRRFSLILLGAYLISVLAAAFAPSAAFALLPPDPGGTTSGTFDPQGAENYVFYAPKSDSDVSKIANLVKTANLQPKGSTQCSGRGGCTNTGNQSDIVKAVDDDAFDQTFVYAKGGVFGTDPVALEYDQDETERLRELRDGGGPYHYGPYRDIYHNWNRFGNYYAYQTTYNCGEHTVQLSAYVKLDQQFGQTANFPSSFVRYRQYDQNGEDWIYNQNGGNNFDKIDADCRPASLSSINSTGTLTIPAYQKLDSSAQAVWGDLDSLANDTAGGGGGSTDDLCSSNVSGVGWILCPVIDLVNGTFSGPFQDIIKSSLHVDPLRATQGGQSTPVYQVWNNIRALANVAFVLVFLVFIFATALQFQLDAYAIKKIIPKLAAAAILVQFSFVLSGVAIDIGNVLGDGIASLLQFTAVHTSSSSDLPSVAVYLIGIVLIGITLKLVGGALVIPLVAIAIVAFIGFLSVMFTLVLRQLIIQVLIVTSPLAFVAFVLPGTEKFFKTWYSNFVKVILMYPIIAILFAASSLLTVTSNGKGLQALIAACFPIVAFYLIPVTFKWAGGVMSWAASEVSNVSKQAKGKASGAWENSKPVQARRARRASAKTEKLLNRLEGTGVRSELAKRWATGTFTPKLNHNAQLRVARTKAGLKHSLEAEYEDLYSHVSSDDLLHALDNARDPFEINALANVASKNGIFDQPRVTGKMIHAYEQAWGKGVDSWSDEQYEEFDHAWQHARDRNFGALQRDNNALLMFSVANGDRIDQTGQDIKLGIKSAARISGMSADRVGNQTAEGHKTILNAKVVDANGAVMQDAAGNDIVGADFLPKEVADTVESTPLLKAKVSRGPGRDLLDPAARQDEATVIPKVDAAQQTVYNQKFADLTSKGVDPVEADEQAKKFAGL